MNPQTSAVAIALLLVCSIGTFVLVQRLRPRAGLNALALLLATVVGASAFYLSGGGVQHEVARVARGVSIILGVMYAFLFGVLTNVLFIALRARKS